jgi:Poly(R)-hydroxyalkanoic acid synthase subunit (PHA_synth_III_E)
MTMTCAGITSKEFSMSEIPFRDPVALWREMLSQWEKGVNAMATQTMATNEFSREMNRVLGASLRMQKTGQELLRRYFDALNIPTKDDLNTLGERLRAMEVQLTRLTDSLEKLTGREPESVGAPMRTKRFAGTVEDKT